MRRVPRNEDYTMLVRCLRYDEVATMLVQFDFVSFYWRWKWRWKR
uniref:Uncharacterized protein n=1 Tax=Picea glauca TaxID=3330 RepID=A0A101M3J6_PICGL|nr:hypothetical protein ABT39_MTgene259 [Picea glauca]